MKTRLKQLMVTFVMVGLCGLPVHMEAGETKQRLENRKKVLSDLKKEISWHKKKWLYYPEVASPPIIWTPAPEEVERERRSLMMRAAMGEFSNDWPIFTQVASNALLGTSALLGGLTGASGASLAYAYRHARLPKQMLLKHLGLGATAAGLSVAAFSLGVLTMVVANPSSAFGAELTSEEQQEYLLHELLETQLSYQLKPDNPTLQLSEIEKRLRFVRYKMAMIKNEVLLYGDYPYEYHRKLKDGDLLRHFVRYETILETDVTRLQNELKTHNDALLSEASDARKQIRETDELLDIIEAAVVQRMSAGEFDWASIVEHLYHNEVPEWMPLFFSLSEQPST